MKPAKPQIHLTTKDYTELFDQKCKVDSRAADLSRKLESANKKLEAANKTIFELKHRNLIQRLMNK